MTDQSDEQNPPQPKESEETSQNVSEPTQEEKILAAIGYLGFLFVVPLIARPKSEYCKFHATQSMVLFAAAIIFLIILGLLPVVGSILTLAIFAVYVIAIYRSYIGEKWAIPFVSDFAKKVDTDALYKKSGLYTEEMKKREESQEQTAEHVEKAEKSEKT